MCACMCVLLLCDRVCTYVCMCVVCVFGVVGVNMGSPQHAVSRPEGVL
jgi:hypothetical protein